MKLLVIVLCVLVSCVLSAPPPVGWQRHEGSQPGLSNGVTVISSFSENNGVDGYKFLYVNLLTFFVEILSPKTIKFLLVTNCLMARSAEKKDITKMEPMNTESQSKSWLLRDFTHSRLLVRQKIPNKIIRRNFISIF